MPLVAPLAGAWVEIVSAAGRGYKEIVAPLAGAWVEISIGFAIYSARSCRSPRGSVG